MKFIKLFLIFGLIYSASAQSRLPDFIQRIFERAQELVRETLNQQIINLIEGQRENIGLGWPALGAPVMDPFLIEDIVFDIDTIGTLSSINFRIRNAYVRGLQQFEILDFDLRIIGLSAYFDVFFKRLEIDGRHTTRMNLGSAAVNGDGSMIMVLNDFKVNGTVNLNTIHRGFHRLNIQELIINLSVGSVNANLRGFGTFLDPTINAILSAAMPSMIGNANEGINESIATDLVPALNEMLNQPRIGELILAIIQSVMGRDGSSLGLEDFTEIV